MRWLLLIDRVEGGRDPRRSLPGTWRASVGMSTRLTCLLVGVLALHLGGTDAFTLRTASRTTHTNSNRHVLMAIEPADVKALTYYLTEVACVKPPAELGGLVGLLVSRGEEVFAPGSDAALHPLLVPLTRSTVDGEVTGLLRWPGENTDGQLPVVRTNGTQLDLLALRADQYVHREAILADTNDAADKADLATLAEQVCKAWDPEAAANAPGGLDGLLLTRVGPFASSYERLALKHLASGSEQAALIACERSSQLLVAWGHPMGFHARMLHSLGREEEARDVARAALSLPLWTLSPMPLDEVIRLAQSTPEELAATKRLKADGKLTAEELRKNNGYDKRTPQEVAKERASFLLDLVIAQPEAYSYGACREELAQLYTEAELTPLAAFVCPEA